MIKEKIDILGILINDITMDEAISRIDNFIRAGSHSVVHTANLNHLRLFKNDPEFAAIYNKADLITVDGMTVILVSKILGTPLKEKISGSDLTEEICRLSAARGYRIYLLGAAEGVAQKAKARCEKLFPGTNITGFYSPTKDELTDDKINEAIIDKINKSGSNIIFVGVGTPFQEKWLNKNRHLFDANVLVGVGGAIDYLAGIIQRPPIWVRKIGMEWLARLVQNPKWYWKRYLSDAQVFYYVILEKIKRRKIS